MCAQRHRYRIDELAGLVHPLDGHPKMFAMIDDRYAYLDESGIHAGATVCVVAGYFGAVEPLRQLETAWTGVLNDFHFPLHRFHAKKLYGRPKREPMLLALTKIISEQRDVHPISIAVAVEDFNSFPEPFRKWMTGGRFDAKTQKWTARGCPKKRPYFAPFQVCLSKLTDCAPVGGKMHFAFGLDQNFYKYAVTMFRRIKAEVLEGTGDPDSEWTGALRHARTKDLQ